MLVEFKLLTHTALLSLLGAAASKTFSRNVLAIHTSPLV